MTLPCGKIVTPGRNTFLKYNACAFTGQVLQAPNGNYIPNQFWVGNSAQTIGDLRGPGRFNVDLSLRRTFPIKERLRLEIAADASNLLNNTQLNTNYNGGLGNTNTVNNPAAGFIPGLGTSSTFGTIGVAAFDPRQISIRVRLVF